MAKTKYKTKKNTVSKKSNISFTNLKFPQTFIVIILVVITLLATANIQTTQNLTAGSQNVLGEDEHNEEEKQEVEQKEEVKAQEIKQEDNSEQENEVEIENENEQEDKIEDEDSMEISSTPRTSIKSKKDSDSQDALKMKTESEDEKQENEIETLDGQKIKTKIEDDGTTKIEIENGTIKLKYSIQNGQIVLNVENENGEEVEIEDDQLEELENEVENELEDDGIKLITTSKNRLALTQNQIAALTDFPLSINVETKELIITTPAGQKIVTVLPNEAVQNLLATGIINNIDIPPSDISGQDKIDNLTGVVEIETRDEEIVYKIKGNKTHRVLGIIPVSTPVTAFVSTDTGLTVAKQQSIFTNIIDLISS